MTEQQHTTMRHEELNRAHRTGAKAAESRSKALDRKLRRMRPMTSAWRRTMWRCAYAQLAAETVRTTP